MNSGTRASVFAAAAAALAVLASGKTGTAAVEPLFVEVASTVGLDFTHIDGATGQYYMPEIMGSGVALLDYDGDGDLDVFFVQGGTLAREGARGSQSRLFRNDLAAKDGKRTLRFTDVTTRAGLSAHEYGMGAAAADYDNDGDVDLFVTTFGPEHLYRNNGDGTFTDVTAEAGTSDSFWSTSATFFDYDRDGDLDLYVANYLDFTIAGNKQCYDTVGARDYCSPRAYRPLPDRLYRNDGRGRFADVTDAAGIAKATGAGLGVVAGDFNLDGWLDLYVANDANPNLLWINRHDGTFVDEGLLAGAAVNAAGNPEGSMGIASGDFDADADEDLFVTNIIGETFVLYANDGHGNFEDARNQAGLARPTASFTGFGTEWFDYDNDGWLDLFVTNGGVNIIETQRGQPRPFRMRNQLFRNAGPTSAAGDIKAASARQAQVRFEEVGEAAGPAFARAEIGRGAALGDIDNDGDIDMVVTNNGGPARLLLNQAAAGRHWLQVRLEQPSGNRVGVGAWVGCERGGHPALWRRVKSDGSYLSASDSRVHFGLGTSSDRGAVVVQWPDGQRERWTDVDVDRLVTLKRGSGRPVLTNR